MNYNNHPKMQHIYVRIDCHKLTHTAAVINPFNEKLDVFSEIIVRYDNETYFESKITIISFESKSTGFDLANMIKKYKN